MTAQELNHPLSSDPARPALPERVVALYRSERFRQAVRVALAMVVAYYISLAMGWDRPHWAGLAVAVASGRSAVATFA
jgi:uncharacterized membrane protein YccC